MGEGLLQLPLDALALLVQVAPQQREPGWQAQVGAGNMQRNRVSGERIADYAVTR